MGNAGFSVHLIPANGHERSRHRNCTLLSAMDEDPDGPDEREPLEGRYANFFQVGHNAFEFVLEFGQANLPAGARYHTRIVTSPVYAKAFLAIMRESIERYEQAFGPIPESKEQDS
jgi:Protein of unknown function (DUF3467)